MDLSAGHEKRYTLAEFAAFTARQLGNEQYELIDGHIYAMSPSPSTEHQRLSGKIFIALSRYLDGKPCEAFTAPLDVYLAGESGECENVLQPDVFVVCDKSNIREDGIHGAPDFAIEIVSPSTSSRDYIYKLSNYFRFGVREYWIVNPKTRQIVVYEKAGTEIVLCSYTFNDIVKVGIFDDLYIDFKEMSK